MAGHTLVDASGALDDLRHDGFGRMRAVPLEQGRESPYAIERAAVSLTLDYRQSIGRRVLAQRLHALGLKIHHATFEIADIEFDRVDEIGQQAALVALKPRNRGHDEMTRRLLGREPPAKRKFVESVVACDYVDVSEYEEELPRVVARDGEVVARQSVGRKTSEQLPRLQAQQQRTNLTH